MQHQQRLPSVTLRDYVSSILETIPPGQEPWVAFSSEGYVVYVPGTSAKGRTLHEAVETLSDAFGGSYDA